MRKLLITKNAMRCLTILLIIFWFCNMFVVRGGVSISAYTYSSWDAGKYMILAILIPIVVAAFLFIFINKDDRKLSNLFNKSVVRFIKRFDDRKIEIIISVCMIVDLVLWIRFRAQIKAFYDEQSGTTTTVWYILNMLTVVALTALALASMLEHKSLDCEVRELFEILAKYKGNTADVTGYCTKCGAPIKAGSKFCTKCGAVITESPIENIEKVEESNIDDEEEN